MANVVNIVVTATNMTRPGFAGAEMGLKGIKTAAIAAGTAIAAALVDIGVKSVKMAMNFDAEMMKLHTQAGVAKDQLGVLSRGVLDLAGKVGQDPMSLAQALFHVESNFASLGITSTKALQLVKIAAEGASVGGANLVDVTNALTAAVASGIPGVEDFSKAMGVLNATVGAGDMTMQDLANALSSGVLAVVKGYGLTITDVSAALATFGDNNIRGKVAATDLRMAVQSLAVPAKDGVAMLEKWGISAGNLAKDMQQHGLLFALEHLQQLFKQNGVTATQQGDIITQMFGKKAGSGIAILMGQMDRLKSKYPDLIKGANNFGEAWSSTNETVKQKWNDMVNFMRSKMIDFGNWVLTQGDKIVPKIDKALPVLKKDWDDLVSGIRHTFETLGPIFKTVWKDLTITFKDNVKEFKKDWPEIKLTIIAVAVALGAIVTGLLAIIDVQMKLTGIALRAWKLIVDVFLISAKDIVDAAAFAFGWIPGLGPELKKAKKNMDDFVAHTLDQMSTIPRAIHVTVVVDSSMLDRLQGTYNQQVPYAARHAVGGIASGLIEVGERGRELIRVPSGSHVSPTAGPAAVGAMLGVGSSVGQGVYSFEVGAGADTAVGTMIMNLLRQGKIVIRQRYITT